MGWKIVSSLIFAIFAILLLFIYWFIPFNTIDFGTTSSNSNFSLGGIGLSEMQFYSNMRFPEASISYNIGNCPLQKRGDMIGAFEIIENLTSLTFYSVLDDEQISITCDSKAKIEGGKFIAGEGGPTNITKTSNFNVIFNGQILLLKDFNCGTPNVAIHELLHVLGFNHSSNKNNLMYSDARCGQTIGEDTIDLINEIYSISSYADLTLENVSAVIHGKYLDANISIRNNGLKDARQTKLVISSESTIIKEFDVSSLEIGYGKIITLTNIWVKKININEIEFLIQSDFDELEKSNNKVILEIKK